MVYNHFVTALTQRLEEVELLPVPEEAVTGEAVKIEGSYIFEPDERDVLADLIPRYLEVTIYRALLESTASEHGARMTAMRNASDNAGTLIDDLTLKMNRARQAEITQEILEVVAGADALSLAWRYSCWPPRLRPRRRRSGAAGATAGERRHAGLRAAGRSGLGDPALRGRRRRSRDRAKRVRGAGRRRSLHASHGAGDRPQLVVNAGRAHLHVSTAAARLVSRRRRRRHRRHVRRRLEAPVQPARGIPERRGARAGVRVRRLCVRVGHALGGARHRAPDAGGTAVAAGQGFSVDAGGSGHVGVPAAAGRDRRRPRGIRAGAGGRRAVPAGQPPQEHASGRQGGGCRAGRAQPQSGLLRRPSAPRPRRDAGRGRGRRRLDRGLPCRPLPGAAAAGSGGGRGACRPRVRPPAAGHPAAEPDIAAATPGRDLVACRRAERIAGDRAGGGQVGPARRRAGAAGHAGVRAEASPTLRRRRWPARR